MSELKDNIVYPLLTAVFALALGVVVSEVQSKVGWLHLVTGLVIVLVVYGITTYVVVTFCKAHCTRAIGRLSHNVLNRLDKNEMHIIDDEGLVAFEDSRDFGSIWLITSDLTQDIPNGCFFDVVGTNIKRGISYTYFAPDSNQNRARIESIRRGHANTRKLHFCFLPEGFFFLTSRLDFCIYDPKNVKGERFGYMGLPIDGDERHYIPVHQELLDSVVGELISEIKEDLQ